MANVFCEQFDDLVILRVVGNLSIDEIHETIKTHFPKVNHHVIWDFTNGHLSGTTLEDLKGLPAVVLACLPTERTTGKTAYVCPMDYDYGMLRMYSAIADLRKMPFEYGVYRTFKEALEWVKGRLP